MENYNQKLDYQVENWSEIRYMVKCHWGVKVNSDYPKPVINEYYFKEYSDMVGFVEWYELENGSANKKILMIIEIARHFKIEIYEVAKKVRLAS